MLATTFNSYWLTSAATTISKLRMPPSIALSARQVTKLAANLKGFFAAVGITKAVYLPEYNRLIKFTITKAVCAAVTFSNSHCTCSFLSAGGVKQ